MDEINKEDDPHWLQVLERKQQTRKKRKRQVFFQKLLIVAFVLAAGATVFFFVAENGKKGNQSGNKTEINTAKEPPAENPTKADPDTVLSDPDQTQADGADSDGTDTDIDQAEGQEEDPGSEGGSKQAFQYIEKTRTLGGGISSNHAVLVDVENGTVLACKDEADRIVPASMTKVLTL